MPSVLKPLESLLTTCNGQVTARTLTALGVGFVDTAEDGLVGVDKVLRAEAAQQPFTLVLMDYTMPLCDGAEVFNERERGARGSLDERYMFTLNNWIF